MEEPATVEVPSIKKETFPRTAYARFSLTVSWTLLLFVIGIALLLWYTATQDHKLPIPDPRHWTSNHGPWRHYPGLILVEAIWELLFVGSLCALVSNLFKRDWKAGLLFALMAVASIQVFFYSFYL